MSQEKSKDTKAIYQELDAHIQEGKLKNGETLKTVQTKLNDLGHDSGKVDGLIGPNTRRGLDSYLKNYADISAKSRGLIQAEVKKNKPKDIQTDTQSSEKEQSAVKVEGDKLVVTSTIKGSSESKDGASDLRGYYYDSENGLLVRVDGQGKITNLSRYGITGTYDRENKTAIYTYKNKAYTQIEINDAPKVMADGQGTRISERQGLRAVDYNSRTKTAATYINDLIQVEESGEFRNNVLYTGDVRNTKTGEVLETYEKGKLTHSNNPGTIVAIMSKQ